MKRFFFRAVLCLLVLAVGLGALCSAYAEGETAQEETLRLAGEIADGVMSSYLAEHSLGSVQNFADEVLPGMVGVGGEWYAIALRQRDPSLDLSAYSTALQTYLRDRTETQDGPVVQQRYALALLAVGGGASYLSRVALNTVGQLGHMSYVYGLHLANCGLTTDVPAQQMITWLLDAQCADGGWSLSGKDAVAGDVDVTAMTLQALASHRDDAQVAAAAERAWDFLSVMQRESGDYTSYGVSCPESGAQVIIALCAWGYPVDDARFVKNGVTLIDGILRYRLDNGRFAHTLDGEENLTATVQSFCAMVAIERAADGRGALYEIDRMEGMDDLTLPVEQDGRTVIDFSRIGAKGWVCLGIVVLALLACFILFMRGKRGAKQYLSVALLAAVALGALLLIDIRSVDDYYSGEDAVKENPVGSVTLTIRCDTVVGLEGTEHLPDDGVILAETVFAIEADDTVFDILTEAAAKYNLRVQNNGATATSSALAYISGINDLYEYDFGDLSGWMYFVNGVAPSVGCGEYLLTDGDQIAFLYTCDLGDDLK